MARFSRVILAFSAILSGSAPSLFAKSADMEVWAPQMANAFVQLLQPEASAETRQKIEQEMVELGGAYSANEMFADRMPQAFVQAASLAHDGSVPATRGVMYDLARIILVNGADMSGKPEDSFETLRIWNAADPIREEFLPGMGLAQSDIDALDRLRALDVAGGYNAMPPANSSEELIVTAWRGMTNDVDKVFPTKLNAYVDGVEANWDKLSPEEQKRAVSIFTAEDFPKPELTKKMLGADDYVFWLGTVLLPMSDEEEKASKELVHLVDNGVFSGPMEKPLTDLIVAMRQKQSAGGGDLSGATLQLFRLNNYGAAMGEMHSWEAYRYGTMGY